MEAARCALKTDRETVLATALSATERERDLLRILQQLHQLATDSFELLEKSGLELPDAEKKADRASVE